MPNSLICVVSPPANPNQPILSLGEVIADLVCEQILDPEQNPPGFVPHPGGALANVAVAASRAGAASAIIGGVGSDMTGRWLRAGLRAEGVSTEWLAEVEGADSPVALVVFDRGKEPEFHVYGEHIGDTMAAAAANLEAAVAAAGALVIGSNTMVGEVERAVTEAAIDLAHSHAVPILFDPNFRPNRWPAGQAAGHCRKLCAESAVIKCNRLEAELITGLPDPAEAARQLARVGPRLAVVTDGAGPIFASGATSASFAPPPTEVLSPLGAGDAFMGTLAAGLARLDWDFSGADELLAECAAAAAAVCGNWGAR